VLLLWLCGVQPWLAASVLLCLELWSLSCCCTAARLTRTAWIKAVNAGGKRETFERVFFCPSIVA